MLNVDDKEREEAKSAVNELIESALAYHTPERFHELMEFASRMPRYAPYNAMLLHIQHPKARYIASAKEWAEMGLKVKPGSRPLVVLQIMGPVRFVFDVADTYGNALPEAVRNAVEDPFHAQGEINELVWGRMLGLCASMSITVAEEVMHVDGAGYVQCAPSGGGYDLRINECHDRPTKFATLAHELGHLFCGHVGKTENDFWDHRGDLAIEVRELEAEAVAYLVASRRKLHTASKKYLSHYLHPNAALPPISLEHILKAAGAVEEMAGGKLPAKERARRKKVIESKPRQRLLPLNMGREAT
ncbi:ImmA/IrrE family metallo-endopeptidase [Prosthecobacter sp.]|uniref:ImmA/IrrE family metallo-endopeptidase n=1 Tax=Prosthecobacter sp. TaxID=1965333 RepID=UPI002ABBA1D6|nr:ImmA/IrrE family metallo-endopeptidase [Prosthecobacter sp.]MDZ4403891.1 ImmA/IrrE family metallo-endopeptidase [Prosthecobacter sp.]